MGTPAGDGASDFPVDQDDDDLIRQNNEHIVKQVSSRSFFLASCSCVDDVS